MKSRLTVEQQTVPINDMSTDLLIVPGVILILNWGAGVRGAACLIRPINTDNSTRKGVRNYVILSQITTGCLTQ